jgi:signal transduction histidine kinase
MPIPETAGVLIVIIALLLILSVSLVVVYRRKIIKLKSRIEEAEADRMNYELIVGERTRNLEMIRDSVSEYAVQKSELAQELESINTEMLRQRDDLFKQSEKLKAAYEEIKKLEAYRQQMTRMIVHDLKNPLNLIINIAETNDMSKKSSKMISRLSWGMLDLIMNILEVNKLENMMMKINFDSFDLSETVSKLLDKFSFILFNSSVTLKNEIAPGLIIYADPKITERIFDNLISNAIKYTSSGGTITLSAVSSSDMVIIEISDDGSGIPSNILNEVFTEYVHGENRSFAYSNSTGIGLAYCKLAVEAMHGSIGISSKEGRGTSVWFKLKKGVPGPGKSENLIPDNGFSTGNKPLIPEFTSGDKETLIPVISQLRKAELDEVSTIIKILDNGVQGDNEKLLLWKEQVLKAAYKGDPVFFRKLLDINQ